MEDGNESLQKMRLQDKNESQYVDDDMVSTHDDTEVSSFTKDLPSRIDQLLDVLNRNKANLPSEVLNLLKQAGIPPQGGRGEISPSMKTTSALKGWLIRKSHKKTQSFRYKNKNNINIANKKTVTKNTITQNIIHVVAILFVLQPHHN